MAKKEIEKKEIEEILKNEVGDFIPTKELPSWDSFIKSKSLENALQQGIIYPKFRAYKNTVYLIKILSYPRAIESDKGLFHSIDVVKDNMKFTLNMNNSFKFQLKVLLERNKTDLQTLIDKGVPLHISQDDNGYWSIQLL